MTIKKIAKANKSLQKVMVCEECGKMYFAGIRSSSHLCKACRSKMQADLLHTEENIKKQKAARRSHLTTNYYYKQGLEYEHRLIMEKELGRKLRKDEIVHHIDEDKHNNCVQNLCLLTRSEHVKLHHQLRAQKAK